MKIQKATLFLLLLSTSGFIGCEQSITDKEYNKMINAQFKTAEDTLLLFPKNVADVTKRIQLAKKMTQDGLDELIKLKEKERTFANTAKALDEIENQFSIVANGLEVCQMTNPDKSIRDACEKAVLDLEKFSIDAFLNVALYQAFKAYVDGNAKKETLDFEEQYFLDEEMKSFKRSGFHLPKEEFEKVKKLKKKISELSLEFDTNIAKDKSLISVLLKDLAGIDEDFIKALSRDGEKYILKCDYPTRAEVLSHCLIEKTRRDYYRCFMNRAYPKNKKLLEQIIAKRDELAKVLGFKSFADYHLSNQMAKTLNRAEGFIKDLASKVEKKEEQEFEILKKDLPKGVALIDGKLDPWNVAFAKESYKKKHFDVDDRKIAEYFTMENTIQGIFNIYQKFLGLEFKKINIPQVRHTPVWHEDVFAIEVYKKGNDKPEGWIWLDLHPRDNKYSHACHASITHAVGDTPSVSVLIANFPKSMENKPSLLKHNDVETFFHEFGHAMHGLLGRTKMAGFSGTSTKHDFVEVPSQMFEEWMWDKDMLELVSSHYKTGKTLPEELISKMIELKRFDSGYFIQRLCLTSLLAFDYFKEGGKKDVDAILQDAYKRYGKHVRFDPETHMYAAFGHLTGYGARYYCYMWSKVFAFDLFDTIKKDGLLNGDIGKKLIDKVLGKGGSVDPDIMLKDFLGREPNQNALLKDIGV